MLRRISEEQTRKKVVPLYPVNNKKMGKIELLEDVIADLKFFLLIGNKHASVKRAYKLTVIGLRESKDFVDSLH